MKKKLALALVILILPAFIRGAWFYRGTAERPQIATPDFESFTAPQPPVGNAEPDEAKQLGGMVLVDFSHNNRFVMTEIGALSDAVKQRGGKVELNSDSSLLEFQLKSASAYIVISPSILFTPYEIQLVKNFVQQGGRLMVFTDAARNVVYYDFFSDTVSVYGDVDAVNPLLDPFDIVINNATVTPMGAVWDVPIDRWDYSYRVNLRGPVLLAGEFLPAMINRNDGVFITVSSVGQAYMGAYECFKIAQVHLAATLDAELENTDVCALTIGPGLVRTPGAEAGIAQLAPLYKKTIEEFYEMSRDHILTDEEAGVGFAAAVVLASQFRGQEISSRQALIAAGIYTPSPPAGRSRTAAHPDPVATLTLCRQVAGTLKEQSDGWSRRSLFERQWMFRDFKKHAGMPVEQWLKALSKLESSLEDEDWDAIREQDYHVQTLAEYYEHLMVLARG